MVGRQIGRVMNAATIAAIATAAVSVIGAITALVRALKTENTVQAHIQNEGVHSHDSTNG